MTKIREELLDRMIRIYGFEHPIVIQFANSCLSYTSADLAPMWDKCLETIVKCHERDPYFGEEEEEEEEEEE